MIELCHVTAGYPGRPVLEDVNLAFQGGKITALIGPNGCGKTTLLRAACGLLPLTGGQVLYGGKDLRRFCPKRGTCPPSGRSSWWPTGAIPT